MKSLQWLLLALLVSASVPVWPATEVQGVKFQDSTKLGAAELVLNGAGLRARFFFKVYAMGLYLPQRATTTEAVLAQKGSKRIEIVTLRELSARQFTEALVDGIQKNHSDSELAGLKGAIDEFSAAMLAVGTAPKGALVQIDFTSDSGTRLVFNGEPRGKAIPGEAFFSALLKIWLGEHPAADDLKAELLGKPAG